MEMERTLESRSVDGATAAISPDRCVIVLDRSAGNLSVALRFGETSPSDNVQCKLHAVRHSQLIKDPQHVVLYRVLAQSKSFGYFAIRAAVRNERDDFLLPFRKEILPFGVDNARGRRPLSPERVQNEAEFVLFDPHLATADDVDRFAERFNEQYPAAVACLRNDLDELLTCFRYKSEDQRRKVRTTNAIERRFREVRRRTRPMGTFQDKTSMDRILFAVFTHENKSQGVSTPFLLTQNN